METLPKILRDLKGLNYKKKIKLRYKKLDSGAYSLYLDLWYNGKREYEFLKIHIIGNRTSAVDDEKKLKIALEIRDLKERELMQKEAGYNLQSTKLKADFIEFFNTLATEKGEKGKLWKSTLYHLHRFTDDTVQIRNIDRKFCEDFKDYLTDKVSTNSAKTYFALFKTALNILLKKEIIKSNPARHITIKEEEVERVFLIEDELRTLKATPCDHEEVKNAFLFSCFTGLRISDIYNLQFSDIVSDNGSYYIKFKQQKTGIIQRNKLGKNAIEIFKTQRDKHGTGNVFILVKYQNEIIRLKKWVKNAGIDKNVTFHTGRHTFATMCLTYDVELYTVSKLLGHKDVKTTQIYAKLIDKKRDEAVDKLPRI